MLQKHSGGDTDGGGGDGGGGGGDEVSDDKHRKRLHWARLYQALCTRKRLPSDKVSEVTIHPELKPHPLTLVDTRVMLMPDVAVRRWTITLL